MARTASSPAAATTASSPATAPATASGAAEAGTSPSSTVPTERRAASGSNARTRQRGRETLPRPFSLWLEVEGLGRVSRPSQPLLVRPRHPPVVQRLLEHRRLDPLLEGDLAQRAARLLPRLDDVVVAVVADVVFERGGGGQRRLGVALGHLLV